LEHTVRRQIIKHNPAKCVRKLASQPRKYRLTPDQIRALGATLDEAAKASESPTPLAVIDCWSCWGSVAVRGLPFDALDRAPDAEVSLFREGNA
jgi:hypothetical protein